MSDASVVLFGLSAMFWAMTWMSNRASKNDRAAKQEWWETYERKAVRRHQDVMRYLGAESEQKPGKTREIN